MKTIAWLAAALACAAPSEAHHSISMFELGAPTWLKGRVVAYQAVNPHAIISLERTGDGGQVQRWTVEGPSLMRLDRMSAGATQPRVGDLIEVCGFPYKDEWAYRWSDASGASSLIMHGHMLVMPDGRMQSWGPYGKLENCVRREDGAAAWAEFLNSDPLGRSAWCNSRVFVRFASLAPAELIAEINGLLARPCE